MRSNLFFSIFLVLIISSSALAVTDADIPTYDAPVSKQLSIKGTSADKNDLKLPTVGQSFSFVNSDLEDSDLGQCTQTEHARIYLVYKGGVDQNGESLRAGVQCDVGEYVRYNSYTPGVLKEVPLFKDLWFKSSEDDILRYQDEAWTREGVFGNRLGQESIMASYACYSCPRDVSGCTDRVAINYNPGANVDDGSCKYPPQEVNGCTDSSAINYDGEANVDDESCIYKIGQGQFIGGSNDYTPPPARDPNFNEAEYFQEVSRSNPSVVYILIGVFAVLGLAFLATLRRK